MISDDKIISSLSEALNFPNPNRFRKYLGFCLEESKKDNLENFFDLTLRYADEFVRNILERLVSELELN